MGKARLTNDKNNEVSYKETSMKNNGNDREKACGKHQISNEAADRKADLLIQKFNAPQCRLFFLKCIYHLPEYKIQQAIESSFQPNVKSHIRYFTVIAKKELTLAGY
jgi:hypothetical protein